jgi:hypothetical protein
MMFSDNTPRIIRPNAGFIIPERRFLDVEMMMPRCEYDGRYKLRKHKERVVIHETPWFDNIILDSGLNRWGTGTIIAGAALGTGTTPPVAGNTQLETLGVYTATTGTGHNTGSNSGVSPYPASLTVVYRTPVAVAAVNYTEVGVGWTSTNMFSRALILDGGGAPTSYPVQVAGRHCVSRS